HDVVAHRAVAHGDGKPPRLASGDHASLAAPARADLTALGDDLDLARRDPDAKRRAARLERERTELGPEPPRLAVRHVEARAAPRERHDHLGRTHLLREQPAAAGERRHDAAIAE